MTDAERWALVRRVVPWCETMMVRFGVPPWGREDFRHDLYIYIAQHAHEYDPTRGSVTTWTRWLFRGAVRDWRVHASLFGPRNPLTTPAKRCGMLDEDKLGEMRGRVGRSHVPAPVFLRTRDDEDTMVADLDDRYLPPVVAVALERLPAREQTILVRRANGESLTELGQALGMSRERVRQIQQRGLQRLRQAVGA